MEGDFRIKSWYEKLNKTIAMITASPEYQRYFKNQRSEEWNKSMADSEYGTRARRYKPLKNKELRSCLKCNWPLRYRASFKMCVRCTHESVVSLYRSGFSIDDIAKKFNVTDASVLKYLRDGSRPRKSAIVERIPVMVLS